mmetsp:Transcript_18268/g.43694  ORF Transcript_18268/g.43694 Transcript_18268/m.43694 type:complete len:311 (+) Transcript_18268:435-1367(+)
MPLPTRSVAMRTHVVPLRNPSTAALRAAGLWSEWMQSMRSPSKASFLCRACARSLEATKTRTGGSTPSRSICLRARARPSSEPTNLRCCSTEDVTMLRSPTVILTGSRRTLRASSSTLSGRVALKSPRMMSGWLQAATMSSTCSRKPRSKRRSPSSRMRTRTLERSSSPLLVWWLRRWGVPMSTSTFEKSVPETVDFESVVCFRRMLAVRRSRQRLICSASSRVGLTISADGPSGFSPPRRWRTIPITMGRRYAIVLPEPVGATARSSRSPSKTVIAWRWMGVGLQNLIARRLSRSRFRAPYFSFSSEKS